MQGVCFRALGVVAWEDVSTPRIEQPDDAVVAVEVAGLCGSDLHPFFGRETGLDPGTVMGHEFVGRVLEVGPDVRTVRAGDRVYAPFSTSCGRCMPCLSGLTSRCERGQLFGWRSNGVGLHGGQAERVRVPLADGTLKPLPDGLSADAALLLGDNFSTACFCAEMAAIRPDGVTVVIGCGSVGLLGILAAQMSGAGAIVAVDPVPERRARAAALGAVAVEPGPARGRRRGVAGGEPRRRQRDGVRGPAGRAAAGLGGAATGRRDGRDRLSLCVVVRVLAVRGVRQEPHVSHRPMSGSSLHGATHRPGRARSCRTSRRSITHRFAPADCVHAYDVFAHQRDGCVKAVFEF